MNFNDEYFDSDDQDESTIAECEFTETSLILYKPFILEIAEEELLGVTIDERFQVGDLLGGGWTGAVRNGKQSVYLL